MYQQAMELLRAVKDEESANAFMQFMIDNHDPDSPPWWDEVPPHAHPERNWEMQVGLQLRPSGHLHYIAHGWAAAKWEEWCILLRDHMMMGDKDLNPWFCKAAGQEVVEKWRQDHAYPDYAETSGDSVQPGDVVAESL